VTVLDPDRSNDVLEEAAAACARSGLIALVPSSGSTLVRGASVLEIAGRRVEIASATSAILEHAALLPR
jgi:hypothetical protein